MTSFLGIDPGLSGALALYAPAGNVLDVLDMPVLSLERNGKSKKEIDLYLLARHLDDWTSRYLIQLAVIEKVGSMPGQGVSSMFAFGQAYGIVQMAVASCFIPLTRVTPQKWKGALNVPAAKDGSRARASELLPKHSGLWTRVKDDGRAEASMLALYASRMST